MKVFPNPQVILSFGNFTITWYALLIVVGIFFVYKQTCNTIKKWGYSTMIIDEMLVPLGISLLFGARLYYVIFQWDYYSIHPDEIIKIWNGGLAIHGAILAGILYLFYYCKKHEYSFFRICDAIMPHVLLAQAIGRWGNFVNQEAFGSIASEEFMHIFPKFIRDPMWINGAYRHPVFLYESLLNGLGWILLTKVFRKKFYKQKGDCLWMYMIWYGSVRLWIESMRSDALMLGTIKIAQLVSGIFIVVGVLGLMTKRSHHPKPVVLFDLDGTLIDSRPMIFETFRRVFRDRLPEYPLKEEELFTFFGPTLEETFKRYFKEEDIDSIIEYYQKVNLELHEEYLKAMPKARETLKALKEYGCKIGIVSNKRKIPVELGLKITKLESYVDLVLAKEDLPKAKPDPSGLIKACNELHANYDTCIYVGDNPGDIIAAKNMAAYSIGYSNNDVQVENLKKTNPCRMVKNLSEIVNICKEDRMWRDFSIW